MYSHAIMGLPVKDRVVVYLDRPEFEALRRLSEKTGAPLAELMRRALKMYLEKRGK